MSSLSHSKYRAEELSGDEQMSMLAESVKSVLSGVAMDFIEGGAKKREIYLYDKDVVADGLFALPTNRAIKVTFEYADAPKPIIKQGE